MRIEETNIILFLIVSTLIILVLAILVASLIYYFIKDRILHQQKLNSLIFEHERDIVSTQFETKEYTFREISREIHDNINLNLTLAKLNLNTICWNEKEKGIQKITSSIDILGQTIAELSDFSKSLNSDIIKAQGFSNAIKKEISKISLIGLFQIDFSTTGVPIEIDNSKELILFRIIQESLNNIVKHSCAKNVTILLHYSNTNLQILINDDGQGFSRRDQLCSQQNGKSGLNNIEARVKLILGSVNISSVLGSGTSLKFVIPY